MSKNRHTVRQIEVACRHVKELMDEGVTENHAIRTLELLTDFYAKLLFGGPPSPHSVRHVPIGQWSVEARRLHAENPGAKAKDFFRVEHGTPRRAFARKVLELHDRANLTDESLEQLARSYWKLAVITLDEDSRLNRLARSQAYDSPDARWAACGITFDRTPPDNSN